ncbi:hypothetical protein D3C75_626450 [compost metagenome]
MQRVFIRVFDALHPWRPLFAAIGGMEDQIVGTNGPTGFFVFEINIEQRANRTAIFERLGVFLRAFQRLAIVLQRCIVASGEIAYLPSIQLTLPTCPAITAVQDDAIVANRPTLRCAGKIDCDEVAAQRHFALLEMLASVL